MRFERVVVGVDGSGSSIAAARWTARLLAPDAEVRVVHVLDLPRPPSFLEGRYPSRDRLLKLLREGAESHLSALVETLRDGRASPVRVEIREGTAYRELHAAALASRADLIVVGEHGSRAGLWGHLGTTAERLVRCSSIPVLLVRGHPHGKPENLLILLDDSEPALRALTVGAALGRQLEAKTTIFHAVSSTLLGHVRLVSSEDATHRIGREAAEEAREWFDGHLAEAGYEPGEIAVDIAIGEPKLEVLASIRRHRADLVVLGSHGAGAVARALGGTVVTTVLRGAPCPVLVVPDLREPPEATEET